MKDLDYSRFFFCGHESSKVSYNVYWKDYLILM